jgi:hypothetical protein
MIQPKMITPQIAQTLKAYAASLGFKPEEIAALSKDMRLVEVALKALAWDKLHAG